MKKERDYIALGIGIAILSIAYEVFRQLRDILVGKILSVSMPLIPYAATKLTSTARLIIRSICHRPFVEAISGSVTNIKRQKIFRNMTLVRIYEMV
jgi:hypothetical protein